MKLVPDNALDKIGFDVVRRRLAGYCMGDDARTQALELTPLSHLPAVAEALDQTAEFANLLRFDDPLPIQSLPTVTHHLSKLQIDGSYLTEEELSRLGHWLRSVRAVLQYFDRRRDRLSALSRLLPDVKFDETALRVIDAVLTPEGIVRTDASRELSEIRRRQAEVRNILRSTTERILRQARREGWADDLEPTLRNERLVIPLRADFKSRVDGFVHDVSSSGHTVYVEPAETLGLNNELRTLQSRERNEIIAILTRTAGHLRPFLGDFDVFLYFITAIDLLRAKAKLAVDLGGQRPDLCPDPNSRQMAWLQARHPALILQKGAAQVVPLGVQLDEQRRVLVISGPNAGGKSAALQTVGLLQAMTQAGLLPPASEASIVPVFDALLVDIGDDQSLQNDLSTYTAHLSLMKQMLDGLDRDGLFLIDEFGSGTDPQFGGPMAEALLEVYVRRGAFGVITTHFSNLKDFAGRNPHTVNAAMAFDRATLSPTFRLEQGLPGSSYAFEIAAKVGIPPYVLDAARQKTGSTRAEVEELLVNLREEQRLTHELQQRLAAQQADLDRKLGAIKQKEAESREKRQKLLEATRRDAAQFLQDANKRIEQTIKEIRETEAEKERTKQLRRDLTAALQDAPIEEMGLNDLAQANSDLPAEDLEALLAEARGTAFRNRPDVKPREGDYVRLRDGTAVGTLLSLEGKRATVAFGDLQTSAPYAELIKVEHAPKTRPKPTAILSSESPKAGVVSGSRVEKSAAASTSVDVRGMRVEQAIAVVDRYLDEVLMSSLPSFEILHGKGTGALRQALREHIRRGYPQVARLEDAPLNQGGAGKTVAWVQR